MVKTVFLLTCIVFVYTGHECNILHICENGLFLLFQCCENQTFQFFRQFGVILNHLFGEGISRAGEIIDLGADLGIIKKSGSWYSYNETKLGQGRDASKQVIQDNPELAEELEGLIFAALKEQE